MASMKKDNKLLSGVSSAVQDGKVLLTVYKKLEEILTDKAISFDEKVPALVTVWLRLRDLITSARSKSLDRIIEWAQRHTLNIVLNGDWSTQTEELKRKLYSVVEDVDIALSACEQLTSRRCSKLIEVIKDPWGDSTLCKILNNPDTCSKDEELKYFSSEHGYLVAMRLKKLCDSHCEDLALHFARACLRCLRMPESQNFVVVTTDDQKRYIFDIYIALLHKYKRTHDIINELKILSLDEGLQLVHRFTKKRIESSRIWKHCCRIADLAAQFFMTAAMTKPVNEIGLILTELLIVWAVLNDKLDGFEALPTVMRRIIQTADSAAHIYICCQALHQQYGGKIKSFIIELYIRALTTDMNELEKQKAHSENDKVQETSKCLSEGFLSLADLLQDHFGVSRECVLTSFSLNPTRACMERIEKLATQCTLISNENVNTIPNTDDNNIPLLDTGQDTPLWSNTNSNEFNQNVTTKDRNLDALILIKGDAVIGSKNYDVLSAPNQVLDAKALGLSPQLCDDLAVVLSSPRYQLLSWVLDWNELKSTCEKYLLNAEGTRNPIKELKYLNIDYSQFKDWPSDEERQSYGGIEKGYEQWADDAHSNTDSTSDYNILYGQQSNDSDCSTTLHGSRRRRRKTVRRIYSSDSEYDSIERKVDSHGSDMDTASQDADSLGSDGLQHVSTNKKKSKRKLTNMSHLAILVNQNQSTTTGPNYNTNNVDNDRMMPYYNHVDPTGKSMSLIRKPSFTPNSVIQPILLPEKKLSRNPQTLKTLRMFRTEKSKKESPLSNTEITIPKLVSAPHMNPRVLLNRFDINNVTDQCEDIQHLYNKNRHSARKKSISCESWEDRKRLKLDALINVPGLQTLDLMRPIVMPQTVQVVQLTSNQLNNQQLRNVKPQTSSANISNANMTSTPVTAHIQRIGQPRTQEMKIASHTTEDKNTETTASATATLDDSTINCTTSIGNDNGNGSNSKISDDTSSPLNTMPSLTTSVISDNTDVNDINTNIQNFQCQSSQPQSQSTPTLVNILSQQVIRPTQITTPVNRNPTLINILSQQIVRPPMSQSVPIVCVSSASGLQTSTPTVTTTVTQSQNSLKLVSTNSSQHQILQQLFNAQAKGNSQVLKNVNVVTAGIANTPQTIDASRLVQFLCKTDGKMIQLTPYSKNSNIKLHTVDSNKIMKTVTTNNNNNSSNNNTIANSNNNNNSNNTNNNLGENKLITTSSSTDSSPVPIRSDYEENYTKFIQTGAKSPPGKVKDSPNENTGQANLLPKFQQAFGKTVYQTNNSNNTANTSNSNGNNSNNNNSNNNNNSSNNSRIVEQATNINLQNSNIVTMQTNVTSANTTNTMTVNTGTTPKSSNIVTAIPVQVATANKTTTIPPLGVQATIQGGVIYTRQVPVSLAVSGGQTINLISNATVAQAGVNRNQQILRITSTSGEQMNLVKDTVIRSKMSALLAAALQSGVASRANVVSAIPLSATVTTTTLTSSTATTTTEMNTSFSNQSQPVSSGSIETEVCEVDSSSNDSCHTSATTTSTNTAPTTLVTPMRITLPMMQRTTGPNGIQSARIVRPVLQIPGTMIRSGTGVRQQVVLTSTQPVSNIITSRSPQSSQTVTVADNLMSTHNIEPSPSVSSTTLEQLREFDLVLEQVKERSTTVQPAATVISGQSVRTQAPAEKSDLQDVIQSVNVSYMNQNQKTSCPSVVVVTSYCNVQSVAAAGLTVISQSSSSPCVTPAPCSSGKTMPKTNTKSSKSKTVKTTTTTTTSHTSKTSPVPKPQQKPQEDEQTTQRIFDILAEYAEQLRNSPDLNNKPAPRRRSNPPTNPSQNSKRKKSSGSKKSSSSHSTSYDLSPGADDPRTIGSEDSSCGVVQISVQDSPSQGTPNLDDQSVATDFSSIRAQDQQSETNDSTSTEIVENPVPSTGRQFILTDSNTNQSRNVIIADTAVNEALGKMSNTAAVIVPTNYIAVVSGNSKILAAVPSRSGQNMVWFQSFVNQARKPIVATTQQNVKAIKYATIQPIHGISSSNLTDINTQPSITLATNRTEIPVKTIHSLSNITTTVATVSENDCLSTNNTEMLLNVVTSNHIGSTQTPSPTDTPLGQMLKIDGSVYTTTVTTTTTTSSTTTATTTSTTNQDTACNHNTDTIIAENQEVSDKNSSSNTKSNEKATSDTTNENSSSSSFRLNCTEKAMSNVSVIEKTVRVIPNTSPQSKVHVGDISSNESTEQTIDTDIISNNTIANTAVSVVTTDTTPNITFSEIDCTENVDYTKVYKNDKKMPANTNGPMLGQTEASINRSDSIIVQTAKESRHEKVSRELEDASSTITSSYIKQKKILGPHHRELQIQQRKQAALERELHLQKSLSEECEDLGVDEPSTSDLFPEADLLFDSNNSPSFDQLSQDVDKRYTTSANFQIEEDYNKKATLKKSEQTSTEMNGDDGTFMIETNVNSAIVKESETETLCQSNQLPSTSKDRDRETSVQHQQQQQQSTSRIESHCSSTENEPTITLFSDEDNSDQTLRTDLLFGNLDYHHRTGANVKFDYEKRTKKSTATNCSNCSKDDTTTTTTSSYNEHTLLNASIMETSSSSPTTHYDPHSDTESPPPVHKYKYKYCNRRKLMQQNTSTSKLPDKIGGGKTWRRGGEVIEVFSSDESSGSSSTIPDRAKNSTPTGSSDRKRSSPTWDEDHDSDIGNDSANIVNYKRVYNATSKVMKLSGGGDDDKPMKVVNKNCSNLLGNSMPASPLSASDGELGSFSIGRGTRRSTQRKKHCPCCTSPEKPKKPRANNTASVTSTTTSAIKKLVKGHLNKKR